MVKAAVLPGPGQALKVEEFPWPELEDGSVLLRTKLSEVCGTDVHLFHGRLDLVPYPIIPGHINVGQVEKVSGALRDVHGRALQPGDVVTFLDVFGTCYSCWTCLVAETPNRCPHRRVYGITTSARDGLLGGWSEYIHLRPGVQPLVLPEKVDAASFIGGGCGLPTAFHGVERGGIRLGDTVVVQGSGPVGLNAVILARLAGASRIVLVGAPELRLQLGRELGADAVLDIGECPAGERVNAIKELTGSAGADVTLEATGVPEAVAEGLQYTRDGGVYVLMGQYTDNGMVAVNPHLHLTRKHLEVRGVWGITLRHLHQALEVMARYAGEIPWQKLVSAEYGLNEVNEALADVESQRVIKAVVNPWR